MESKEGEAPLCPPGSCQPRFGTKHLRVPGQPRPYQGAGPHVPGAAAAGWGHSLTLLFLCAPCPLQPFPVTLGSEEAQEGNGLQIVCCFLFQMVCVGS